MTLSPWNSLDLNELSDLVWTTLSRAVEDSAHPWRLPALATAAADGPKVRLVVLPGITRPGFELLAFSDSRTPKIAQIEANPVGAWLFYDPRERVQVRAETELRLHLED